THTHTHTHTNTHTHTHTHTHRHKHMHAHAHITRYCPLSPIQISSIFTECFPCSYILSLPSALFSLSSIYFFCPLSHPFPVLTPPPCLSLSPFFTQYCLISLSPLSLSLSRPLSHPLSP